MVKTSNLTEDIEGSVLYVAYFYKLLIDRKLVLLGEDKMGVEK